MGWTQIANIKGPPGADGVDGSDGAPGPSTVSDAAFTLQDDGDATKQARFQVSTVAHATTRTLTVPDADGIVAYTSDSRFTDARTPTSHTHANADLSEASTVGKAVLAATDQAAARSAIGAGTSNLALGTSGTTAKAGDYAPAAASISDSTVTGRALITATDAAAGRTAIGAGTSNLVIGTTTGTAGDGGVLASAVQSGGALGTPSSGTLSSCGSLPVSGITASTSLALGVGSVELGHATDTTIARSAAGQVTIEGKRVATVGTGTAVSSATPTFDTGTNASFFASLTAQAVDITNMSTNLAGSPVKGDRLWFDITGTAARAIAWGTSFIAGAVALPTTTVLTQRLDVGFIYDGSKWRCMASGSG